MSGLIYSFGWGYKGSGRWILMSPLSYPSPSQKSNIGAEKLFDEKTYPFNKKKQKYFGHKPVKNPTKITISTIF